MDKTLEKAKMNISKMIKNRNYTLFEQNDLDILYKNNENLYTKIHFIIEKSTPKKLQKLLEESYEVIIFVICYIDPIKNKIIISKNLKELEEQYKNKLQIFSLEHLLFDIMENKYVPKHEILNTIDKENILNFTDSSKLPKINITDPMCKYLFAKKDDILKITRKSNNSKEYISYRLCI